MKTRTSLGQHTLPREYFISEEVFRAERERIFSQSWLLAGHVSQLADPGSCFLFELDRESVIVVRGFPEGHEGPEGQESKRQETPGELDGPDGNEEMKRAGEIRAFHNHCRHRGSRLCQEHTTTLGRAIQCPYHAWTYGLDGMLRAAPNMKEVAGFDRADYPLHRVALENWEGFLFLNLAPKPAAFAASLPGLIGKFGHWRLPELRSVHQTVYEVEANWKLFFHNFSECYHCPTVHPHLNKLTPYRNTENDLDEGPVLGGAMWMSNPEGSMTMHGGRCAPPFAGLSAEERARVYYYTLFPSAFLSFHPDFVLVHRAQPLSINRTRIVCEWLFHPEAIAAPDFDPQPAIAFWDLTNRQDWELCANAYRGVISDAWQPGPYSELESQLAAFDRQYLGALHPEAPAAQRRA